MALLAVVTAFVAALVACGTVVSILLLLLVGRHTGVLTGAFYPPLLALGWGIVLAVPARVAHLVYRRCRRVMSAAEAWP